MHSGLILISSEHKSELTVLKRVELLRCETLVKS